MTDPAGRRSTGVIGALGLAEPGEGADVLPHEQTLPKPKSDRLDLLAATGANLSPIWGLSLAPGLSATYEPSETADASAFDDDGVLHELWVIDDPDNVALITEGVAGGPVVIADGHHRYETALTYRRQRRAAGRAGPDGADLVLALVTELAEDQLTVGPIHRTIADLPAGTDLPAAFERWFDVARAGDSDERTIAALGQSGSLALITPTDAYLLMPRAEAAEAAGSDLDSSLVALVLDQLPPHDNVHRHSWREAVEPVLAGQVQAAVLLRPVTVEQIAEWAAARRKMPPKTTYFSPKPRTGMVFRLLEG
jgi:uncharacterized protein (DUF1015 family)